MAGGSICTTLGICSMASLWLFPGLTLSSPWPSRISKTTVSTFCGLCVRLFLLRLTIGVLRIFKLLKYLPAAKKMLNILGHTLYQIIPFVGFFFVWIYVFSVRCGGQANTRCLGC